MGSSFFFFFKFCGTETQREKKLCLHFNSISTLIYYLSQTFFTYSFKKENGEHIFTIDGTIRIHSEWTIV